MKNITLIILLLALTISVQAQRRLHGQQGLQATIGRVDGWNKTSLHAGAALSRFTKNSHQWTFGAEYLRKKLLYEHQYVPVEQFTGEAGYYRTFLSDRRKTFFCSVGLSGMAGYELVNRDKPLLYDGSTILSENRFLFGGAFSFEIETYIVDRIVLITGFRQRILPASTVNKFHNQLSLGVKIIIN
jgi:hypothetical protein